MTVRASKPASVAWSGPWWCVAVWAVMGAGSFVLSVYLSVRLVAGFDTTGRCHGDPVCAVGTIATTSRCALFLVWCGYLESGVVVLLSGLATVRRTVRVVSAIGAYLAGLLITFEVIEYAITHAH